MTLAGRVAVTLLLVTFAHRTVLAQSLDVTGQVSDHTGGVLPGVSVQLGTEGSTEIVEAVTDARGRYKVHANRPGRHQIRFSLLNFTDVTKPITLDASRLAVVDVVLTLALTADVTVTGHRTFRNLADVGNPSESLVGIADAASEGAVTASQIEGRPLGRPADVLETVPGLVISQHSGEGKANQYYLRGFNLDHGTDFAVSVAGIPVNMPTHGHGQGWSDVNFLIPELVSGVQFKKGPYYADEGDFSTAGAANINYVNGLDRPLLRVTGGGDRFGRILAAASPRLGSGSLLAAIETGTADGPWDNPENYKRLNGVVRYSRGNTRQGMALTFMGYDAEWTATDQVPERAVNDGRISRFGTLDASDGGRTHRYSLSAELQRSGAGSTTKVLAYGMDYGLDLFSNFTYLLNDPVNGDQFEQVDRRSVFGVRANHRRRSRLFGRTLEHGVGLQIRHDRIGPLGLYATTERRRISTTREDRVFQTSTGAYYQGELEVTDRFRVTGGIRGDIYHFDVRSNRPENSGVKSTGLVSPKLGVVFAPATRLELYGNFGYGYHSNDARGATISIDPASGEPADRVTPLVRTRGGEFGVRSILIPKLQTTVAVWGLSPRLGAGLRRGRRNHRSGTTQPEVWRGVDELLQSAAVAHLRCRSVVVLGPFHRRRSGWTADPGRRWPGRLRWHLRQRSRRFLRTAAHATSRPAADRRRRERGSETIDAVQCRSELPHRTRHPPRPRRAQPVRCEGQRYRLLLLVTPSWRARRRSGRHPHASRGAANGADQPSRGFLISSSVFSPRKIETKVVSEDVDELNGRRPIYATENTADVQVNRARRSARAGPGA